MDSIKIILDKVESNEIVIPEFQREFVWDKRKSKELMKSLYKDYPIGSFIVWNTENPPKIKNDIVNIDDYASFKVLLDGQQRLTLLYLLTKDDIPPYYNDSDILNDPRDLHFNLMNGEFRYETKLIKDDLEWVKLTDIFNDKINVFEIAKENKNYSSNEELEKAKIYEKQKNKIKNILYHFLPIQELPKSTRLNQAIALYDKVNSQGTFLDKADVALTYMSSNWPDINRHIKDLQSRMTDKGYKFDVKFYVKCIVGVVTSGMVYEDVYNISKEKIFEKWSRIEDIMEIITNLLKNEAYMPNSNYLTTSDVLIPLVVYLDKKDKKMNLNEKNAFLKWLYVALMWSRYENSTDEKLEMDISLLDLENNPTTNLIKEIKDEKKRIEIKPNDLDGVGSEDKGIYNMTKIIIRANDPIKWSTGEPLSGNYELEPHHIFPESKLHKDLYLGKKRINEVANKVFLTSNDDFELLQDLPEYYLSKIKNTNPEVIYSQFIPDNPNLWKIKNYEDFLEKRREIIAKEINDFIDSIELKSETEKINDIKKLIKKGENDKIEFKETLKYDTHQKIANKDLMYEAVKEIASFANSNGGKLIIGVEDKDKKIKGIARDLKLMPKGKDEFELTFNRVISEKLSDSFVSLYTNMEFVEFEGKEICLLSVETSLEPVYYGMSKDFYIRVGSSRKALNTEETIKYIEKNFR